MNIGRLLLLIKFSRYAPTISICLIKRSSIHDTTKNICNNLYLTISEKVSLKSIPYTSKKPCATSLALYCEMLPS